ncbi:MAG: hypothetical protein QHC90_13145 [Shinella sp.]|nr:hypothetical protein [Shinella sp.]
MNNVTNLRLRVLPRFPSRIEGANGFTVVREDGDLVVKPDYGQLAVVPAVPDKDETFFQAWTRDLDTYNIIPFQALVENIQDVIIGPNLAAIDGLSTASDTGIYYTAEGEAATYTVSEFTRNLSDSADAPAFKAGLGLGSAADADADDFASAAQGSLADSSLQPDDIGTTVASAAQGAKADTAVQPAALTSAINAKFVANVLNPDGSRATGYNPAAAALGYYNNSTGSTGYPGGAGLTISFMFGGDNGRAWDIWKGFSGAEDWSVRTSMGDGSFGAWRRLIHDGLKATQAQAEAGSHDTNYMTPLKTAQAMDGRTTRLFGANSALRSQPARFGDTLNLREFLDRTGSDGTATANNAALSALIAYLNANPQIRVLKGNKSDVYRTTAITLSIPAGIRLEMDGARFRWSGNNGGNNNQFMIFGAGCHIVGLGIDIVSGSSFRRLIETADACTCDDMEVIAESQIANYGGSLLDWAVRFYRSDNRIRGAKAVNIDRPWFLYGIDGDGNPGRNNLLEDVEAVSYVTGIDIRNVVGTRNISPKTRVRSPNATTDPGMNGILHEGVKDYVLVSPQIEDAGEHGIRFGGTRNAEQASTGITITGGQIVRSGQSGLKFFTGNAGQTFNIVNVSGVEVIDCASRSISPTPGFNDEGFMIQQVKRGNFSGCSVHRRDNSTYSCMDGMYISGADDVNVSGFSCADTFRNMIRISETDDDGGGSAIETQGNTALRISGATGKTIAGDGVYIDHPTQPLREINIEVDVLGTGASGKYAIAANAAAARFAQPCLFQYKQRNFAAGAHNLPGTANAKTRDLMGSVF